MTQLIERVDYVEEFKKAATNRIHFDVYDRRGIKMVVFTSLGDAGQILELIRYFKKKHKIPVHERIHKYVMVYFDCPVTRGIWMYSGRSY